MPHSNVSTLHSFSPFQIREASPFPALPLGHCVHRLCYLPIKGLEATARRNQYLIVMNNASIKAKKASNNFLDLLFAFTIFY